MSETANMEETEEPVVIRFRGKRQGSRLSKYGTPFEPPQDNAVFYPDDDRHSFFERGRDFESVYVNHKYTEKERETLATYESLDYLPSHSKVYKKWLQTQPSRLDWDRWVMMGFIGVAVGLIGFFVHQVIDVIANLRWDKAQEYIQNHGLLVAWGWLLGHGIIFVGVSAALIVFLRPSAGGSGIPELIGFLNGTVVRHIFNIKTMVVKFLSCCAAVGSGMPVGPEGPMIHLGSLVGAGLSQFKSDTLRFRLPFFERFRNSEDRRNFISAGAAAGVASAFGAPVGGLLFSMEEVSSFWNLKLAWQIFFCAMVSTFTTDLFNSAFEAFQYQGNFGVFKAERYILFQVDHGVDLHILAFIPAAMLGILGGLLGALFNFLNLKIARFRARLLSLLQTPWKQKTVRMAEPVIIMVIVATISTFLPAAFQCTHFTCKSGDEIKTDCISHDEQVLHTEGTVMRYTCPPGVTINHANNTWTNNTYNEVATLLFDTGERAIHHLFSRSTHLQFDFPALLSVLVYYFIVACWSAGVSISSGLVVPMLFIGALYGRIIGRAMVAIFGVHLDNQNTAWMDPGAFALIGAASFFGGVSRLTMSLTVIMMEITNDIRFLLPIMVAIIVAKWVGDFFTHPLYHALLELKCIPFLDSEPVIVHGTRKMINLELFSAKEIMTKQPITLKRRESVAHLAEIILHTPHGGYPVVKDQVFFGFINRLELTVLLQDEQLFLGENDVPDEYDTLDYHKFTLDKLSKPEVVHEMLTHYTTESKYRALYINLEPYANQSSVTVMDKFSLHRMYIIFRTLGLRHLTVVNENNQVVGVVTRKDLMGFNMEEKLEAVFQNIIPENRHVEMTPTATSPSSV